MPLATRSVLDTARYVANRLRHAALTQRQTAGKFKDGPKHQYHAGKATAYEAAAKLLREKMDL